MLTPNLSRHSCLTWPSCSIWFALTLLCLGSPTLTNSVFSELSLLTSHLILVRLSEMPHLLLFQVSLSLPHFSHSSTWMSFWIPTVLLSSSIHQQLPTRRIFFFNLIVWQTPFSLSPFLPPHNSRPRQWPQTFQQFPRCPFPGHLAPGHSSHVVILKLH
jgi:hypothetical protein